MLGTQEHYDLIAMFDREFKGRRLDKEDKSLWKRGIVYQDGHVNELLNVYLRGYAYHKGISNLAEPAQPCALAAPPAATSDEQGAQP